MISFGRDSLTNLLKNKQLTALFAGAFVVSAAACLTLNFKPKNIATTSAVLSAQGYRTTGHSVIKPDSNDAVASNTVNSTATNGSSGPTVNAPSAAKLATAAQGTTIPQTASTPTTTVTKTTVNSDKTTTKEIVVSTPIAFVKQTQNEVNSKRGTTQVAQAGQNGTQTTTYLVTYDQNGKEIARKTVSDVITKQPVTEITKIGVSDYNINTDTWEGTEAGEMCLTSEYGTAGDGCIGTASSQHFGAVKLSGTFYVSCISSIDGFCDTSVNIQLVPISSGKTFNYLGTSYYADARKGGGVAQLITPGICSQYSLACGSW